MNDSIAILVNPFAKKKKVQSILNSILPVLEKNGIPYSSFTEWPQDINIYREIWLIGGDGTLNFFINHYSSITVPVVIFKGGTGNDFATHLYGTIDPAQQAEKVLSCTAKPVDAAECNGRRYINGVGIGFDGEVLRSMGSVRLIGGHIGYLSVVIRKIFSFEEPVFRIHDGASVIEGKFLLVMITNSPQTGGGFKVSPRSDVTDGKLNMVLSQPLSIMKRLINLPIIEKGKHLLKKFIIHKEVTGVRVECEKETLAQVDGELISSKEFEIKVLPGKYLFKY